MAWRPVRRWVTSATTLGVAGSASWGTRQPSLMPWPGWVGPAVTGVVAAGTAVATWTVVDTLLRAPERPAVLVRRPLAVLAVLAGAGVAAAAARKALLPRLEQVGRDLDPGLMDPPVSRLVSGGPESVVPYGSLGREGSRYVHTQTPREVIEGVLGSPSAAEPIRVFVGFESAPTIHERVVLAMEELRRTGAFGRSMLLIQAPAGSGYANPTPVQVMEIATGGDCASVAVGYGLLPSFLSLDRIDSAASTQRLLLDAIFTEIEQRPSDQRPAVVLYGESLGARVQQQALDGDELASGRVRSALWVGTPGGRASDAFRTRVPDDPIVIDRPEQLPHPPPSPHPVVWFLEHDGDPVVRLRRDLLHRRPVWLTGDARGRHVPEGMRWLPVVTWIQVLVDTFFATQVTPGEFDSRGHDYRGDLGAVVAAAFDLRLGEEAAERIESALRGLEVERARRFEPPG